MPRLPAEGRVETRHDVELSYRSVNYAGQVIYMMDISHDEASLVIYHYSQ